MILVVDNYDSFAYNLVQAVAEAELQRSGARLVDTESPPDEREERPVVVRRNDAIDVTAVRDLDPDGIVVSPGPGTPANAGVSIPIFRELTYPTLGVCLGHQALCAAGGATVVKAPEVVHGKPSDVVHDGEGVFAGLSEPLEAGRYHSLAVERGEIPGSLVETATTDDEREVVMGVRHRSRPHVGVQFHPESILTAEGKQLLANFVDFCYAREGKP